MEQDEQNDHPGGAAGQKLMDGLMRDIQRAAALGLIPEEGMTISKRGEFLIGGSNIDEMEDKKMRNYRYKAYPKTLHKWGKDKHSKEEGAQTLIVRDKAAHAEAEGDGWSEDPVINANGERINASAATAGAGAGTPKAKTPKPKVARRK